MDSQTSVHVIKTACHVVVAVFVCPAALCADHYLRCLILSLASKAEFVYFVEIFLCAVSYAFRGVFKFARLGSDLWTHCREIAATTEFPDFLKARIESIPANERTKCVSIVKRIKLLSTLNGWLCWMLMGFCGRRYCR
ncbi:hypothetical protein Pelo_1550, partial [Pelomyxa schiedti]